MSRDIEDLTPAMQKKARDFQVKALGAGIDVLIYCTYRTVEEQAMLYRQGRTLPAIIKKADELAETYGRDDLSQILMGVGPQYGQNIVTWAGPGQSMHNYRRAFDFVPLFHGKPIWEDGTTPEEDKIWHRCGEIGKSLLLDWAGEWVKKKEYPHMQDVEGPSWRAMIRTAVFR